MRLAWLTDIHLNFCADCVQELPSLRTQLLIRRLSLPPLNFSIAATAVLISFSDVATLARFSRACFNLTPTQANTKHDTSITTSSVNKLN